MDCAPFASLHREGLSADELRSWSALVEQGAAQENAASYTEALKLYQAAASIDGDYAELEFRIARCLQALGDYSAARKHFLRARDLDTLRFRADSRINQINRSVALSSGANLVDSDAIFDNESLHGITGSDLIYEHVHLTPPRKLSAGSRHVGRDRQPVASSSGDNAIAGPTRYSLRSGLRTLAGLHQTRSFAGGSGDVAEAAGASVHQPIESFRPGFPAHGVGRGFRRKPQRYSRRNISGRLHKNPDDRILHFNFGVFLEPYNPAAAEQQFAAARPFDGFPLVTPDGRIH